MRLDIALMHRTGGEGALDDDFGFAEALRDVALLDFEPAADVRRLAFELVMNSCRIGASGFSASSISIAHGSTS